MFSFLPLLLLTRIECKLWLRIFGGAGGSRKVHLGGDVDLQTNLAQLGQV